MKCAAWHWSPLYCLVWARIGHVLADLVRFDGVATIHSQVARMRGSTRPGCRDQWPMMRTRSHPHQWCCRTREYLWVFGQYILSVGPVDLTRTYPSCKDPSGPNLAVNRACKPLHISALRAPLMGLPLGPVGAFSEPGPLSYCRSVACVGI